MLKNVSKLLVALVLCFVANGLKAQSATKISNEGKEFWVGYGHHHYMEIPGDNSQNMVIYITNNQSQTATVVIEQDSSGILPTSWWRQTMVVPANSVRSSACMPKGATYTGGSYCGTTTTPNGNSYDARLWTPPPPLGNGGDGIFSKAVNGKGKSIHIKSNVPIVAYAHIYGGVSSGATMLLPVESWGYSYTTINSYQANVPFCRNFFYVIANRDSTFVRITPSQTTRNGSLADTPFIVRLDKGHIYQCVGTLNNATLIGPQFTGSKVESAPNQIGQCHPIAVFAGSSRTLGEPALGGAGRDNDMQQCFPYQSWGKKYLTAPFSQASSSTNITPATLMNHVYKIVVQDTSANILVNGNLISKSSIIDNKYYQYTSSTADYIESDKPIMVGQFICGGGFNGLGDPEMVYITPMDQAINKVGFYRNVTESINVNYVTLIVPDVSFGSLRIDGFSPPNFGGNSFSYVHPNLPGYRVVAKGWPSAAAQCKVTCDTGFTGITYGLGGAESYAYSIGAYFDNLNARPLFRGNNDTSDPRTNHPYIFAGSPSKIRVAVAFSTNRLDWKFSKAVDTSKIYTIRVIPNDSARNRDTTDLLAIADTLKSLKGSVLAYIYDCPGIYKFIKKKPIGKRDTFYLPVALFSPDAANTSSLCSSGSNGIEVILPIYILDEIKPNFTVTKGACVTDSVTFNGPAISNGLNVLKWKWSFPDGSTSTSKIAKALLPKGNSNVRLEVVVEYGGTGDTTKVVFLDSSLVKYTVKPDKVCVGSSVNFLDSTISSNPITNYFYDYGNGTVANFTTNAPHSYTYNTVGTFVTKHVVTIPAATCPIDTIFKTVSVAAKAYVDFIEPTTCLPTSGLATFAANNCVACSPYLTTNWDFGDPASGANNTSNADPTAHIYQREDTFLVKLSVVNATGCNGDTTKKVVIKKLPNIQKLLPITKCGNDAIFTMQVPNILNIPLAGTGVFRSVYGLITNANSGSYDPSLNGGSAVQDTVYYTFTTKGGCKDSVYQLVNLLGVPDIVYNFLPNTGCLDPTGLVNFYSSSTVSGSTTLPATWSFNLPSSAAGDIANSDNATHNFVADGTYNMQIQVAATNGCKRTILFNQLFTRYPAVDPIIQKDICDNDTNFFLTPPIITNGVVGTGLFSSTKNAVLYGTVYDPSIAGYGVDTLFYTYTATGGNMCATVVKKPITIHARPRGNFTFSPNGCLDPTGKVDFTANINVPNSSVSSYAWQFEYPSTSAVNVAIGANVSHNYNDGLDTIKLHIVSADGCNFDTIQKQVFSKKPLLAPKTDTTVCESALPYQLNAPMVLNGVVGNGVFTSVKNAVTTGNIYNPSIAGYGVDTIIYTYTSTGALPCDAVVKSIITINARPRGTFSFVPNTGCLDASGKVDFTANIHVPNSSVASYDWQFEAPSTAAVNIATGATATHFYNDGLDTIKLHIVGTNGCFFDTIQKQIFSRAPSIAPLVIANPCENATPTFIAPAITNGVVGVGTFISTQNALGNAATGNYNASIAGYGKDTIFYKYTSSSIGACADSVSTIIDILSIPKGKILKNPAMGCLESNGKVEFDASNIIAQGSIINSYQWNFDSPNTSAINLSNKKIDSFFYQKDSIYIITLAAIAANGCQATITETDTFNLKPSFAKADTAICENDTAFALVVPKITNNVIAKSVKFVSKLGGIINDTLGIYKPVLVVNGGLDTVYYVYSTKGGCKDSTIIKVNVKKRPRATFAFIPNTGCLDATGKVQFLGYNNTPNALYTWYFNYPSKLAIDSSVILSPIHYYSDGVDTIKFKVNDTTLGCSFDTTQVQAFSRKPALVYPALANICVNAAPVKVNFATVTNGVVAQQQYYVGNGCDSLGNFNPTTAGVGNHRITYYFKTIGGCIDSVKSPITVYPTATAAIVSKVNVCIDSAITLQDVSTIVGASIATRNWSFGDATTAINPVGNIIFKKYLVANNYIVALTITTNNGCITSDTQSIDVRPKPVARFDFPNKICMPNGLVSFSNQSTIAANGGVLDFSWNFGDANATPANANTSILPTPNHSYLTSSDKTVLLTVVSNPYNCIDTLTRKLVISAPFFDKPVARFVVKPDTLCQGSISNFDASASVAPNANIASYDWNFGENPSSVASNSNSKANYTYSRADSFKVDLSITSSTGCSSDTVSKKVYVYPQPTIISIAPPNNIVNVLSGNTIQLQPNLNDTSGIKFIWSVNSTAGASQNTTGFSSNFVLNPFIKPLKTTTYLLTAIGQHNCKDTGSVLVKVLGKIEIPNSFSPNGDGKNDYWEIKSLGDYPGVVTDVFDRYGISVYHKFGYAKWDGTLNGVPLAVGTYYYIINPGQGLAPISGWLLIIR
jgi:gliding motility-associated-like protein